MYYKNTCKVCKNHFILESIIVETNSNFLNSKQTIFICLKEKIKIPIIQMRKPLNLNKIEEKASELASFLKVSVKGI